MGISFWTTADSLPGEGVDRRDYLDVVADTFGLTPDEIEQMEDERAAFEAEFPPVDLDSIPAGDPWGMASEWDADDDDDLDLFGEGEGEEGAA